MQIIRLSSTMNELQVDRHCARVGLKPVKFFPGINTVKRRASSPLVRDRDHVLIAVNANNESGR